ncbi:MAG: hypothetical protein ACI8ZN_002308, partial [Bacteroidia bacterium]
MGGNYKPSNQKLETIWPLSLGWSQSDCGRDKSRFPTINYKPKNPKPFGPLSLGW